MAAMAAIGVDDDLAARQPGVTHRTSDYEAAGGIDMMFHACRIIETFGHYGLDDFIDDVTLDLFVRHVRAVLCRDDDGIDAHRFSIPIFHGHLRFSIGSYPGEDILFPDLRQSLVDPMGEYDRHRHQLFCMIGGIAEHQPLIAGGARIHAHGDVARLLVDG